MIFNNFDVYIGSDFSEENVTVAIPPTKSSLYSAFQLPPSFIQIFNDRVNENVQSFVLVAEVMLPDDDVCFKRLASDTTCHGSVGATQINIIDDDGKQTTFNSAHSRLLFLFRTYIYWI